jgi:hypothetical protein
MPEARLAFLAAAASLVLSAATLEASVDWSYDTPVRHYVTIYRVVLTASGLSRGESTLTILQAVTRLAGIEVDDSRITMPTPPTRDPFRRTA